MWTFRLYRQDHGRIVKRQTAAQVQLAVHVFTAFVPHTCGVLIVSRF